MTMLVKIQAFCDVMLRNRRVFTDVSTGRSAFKFKKHVVGQPHREDGSTNIYRNVEL
jgi:hypothetical protein